MALNLSACPIVFKVKNIDGEWIDYSKQVESFAYTSAKMPDDQPGAVLPAWMEITLIACEGGEPLDNYKDPYLFFFKQETEIQILANDGQYYYIPSKQWVIHGTPQRDGCATTRNVIELGCIQKLMDIDTPFDSTAMDIKLGGEQITPIQFLITRAFRLAGIFTDQKAEFTAQLNYPRNFGNNYIQAADDLMRSGCQISWSRWDKFSAPGDDLPFICVSSIDIDTGAFRTVRWDECEILSMVPFREPLRPDNGNLLADKYVVTCTDIYKYKRTPSPLVSPDNDDGNGQTVTSIETIDFDAISSTTKTSEHQLGATVYDGLPGAYPSGSVLAQETRHFKLWESNGSKRLIKIDERTDQRCAIALDAVKGYLIAEKQKLEDQVESILETEGALSSEQIEDLEEANTKLAEINTKLESFNWQALIQGAKDKEITHHYRGGDERLIKIVTKERMTPVEALSGLGNAVDWCLVIDECPIVLKVPDLSKVTTTVRWESGYGRWHERTTVRTLKCMGTSNHKTELVNRLEGAKRGSAADDEDDIPNVGLFCQIIAEALSFVTLPPVTRVLDNGETKPESLDTAPEKWSAEQTQVSDSVTFPNTQTPEISIVKELTIPYAGDFNADSFGGESSARAFCRRYGQHTGELARAKQFTWDGQGPVWPELLQDNWHPWMAFDYVDCDGTTYRVAFDGISIVGNAESCRWNQKLVTLGQVDGDGSLIFNYTQVQ